MFDFIKTLLGKLGTSMAASYIKDFIAKRILKKKPLDPHPTTHSETETITETITKTTTTTETKTVKRTRILL